jgi:hypothetical protein
MAGRDTRVVARLTPTASTSTDGLLEMSLGLDVWESRTDELIVAASEGQLAELERRGLAFVERLHTVEEYLARAEQDARAEDQRGME